MPAWPYPPRSPNYYLAPVGMRPIWDRRSMPDRRPGGDRPGSPAYKLEAGAPMEEKMKRIQSAAHNCPECRFYAWDAAIMEPVSVAGRWHHPTCPRVQRARNAQAVIDTTGVDISYPPRDLAQIDRPGDATYAQQVRSAYVGANGCRCEAGALPILNMLGGGFTYTATPQGETYAKASSYTMAPSTSYAQQQQDKGSTTYGQIQSQTIDDGSKKNGGDAGGAITKPEDKGFPWAWTLGGVGVLALVGLAVWGASRSTSKGRRRQRRRRRRRNPRRSKRRRANPRRAPAEAQHARSEGKRLRAQLQRERVAARSELRAVRAQCKAGRAELAEQRRELADACTFQRETAKLGGRERVAKASRDLETFRSIEDARRILRGGSHPRKMRRTSAEALSESDDAVAVNLPDDLIPIWRRVKGKVRGSAHQSRTEAFFHWVEEHPDEIDRMRADAAEEDVERMIREYEQSYAANPARKLTHRQRMARAKQLRRLLRGATVQREKRERITIPGGASVVLKGNPTPAHLEHRGYYVQQWFGPVRGKPDVLGGPWKSKAAAERADRKFKVASKRIGEPLSTRVRYFDTRTEARGAGGLSSLFDRWRQ